MFHANDKAGAEEWIADIKQAFPKWISNYIHYQFHLRFMQVREQ